MAKNTALKIKSGKKLIKAIDKTEDVGQLATDLNSVPDSLKIVKDAILITLNWAYDLKKEEKKFYDQKVKPLLVIVHGVEEELKDKDISSERREALYEKLFIVYREITAACRDYKKATGRNVATIAVSISLGATIGAAITGFLLRKKR